MSSSTVPDKVDIQKDQSIAAQAASPIAALSSHTDPYPHYTASAICAAAAGALYSGAKSNPRYAAAAAGFSLLYFSAGRAVISGHPKLGYDLGSATSLGLAAWTLPMVSTGGAPITAMAVAGGMSAIANLIKSYQYRTGRPHEPIEHTSR